MSPGLIFSDFPREKGVEIPKNQYTKWFDYDKIKDTVSVRNRAPGDYFIAVVGREKDRCKAFMIDDKIPREERRPDPSVWRRAPTSCGWWATASVKYYKMTPDQTYSAGRLDGGEDMDDKIRVLLSEEEVNSRISEVARARSAGIMPESMSI